MNDQKNIKTGGADVDKDHTINNPEKASEPRIHEMDPSVSDEERFLGEINDGFEKDRLVEASSSADKSCKTIKDSNDNNKRQLFTINVNVPWHRCVTRDERKSRNRQTSKRR